MQSMGYWGLSHGREGTILGDDGMPGSELMLVIIWVEVAAIGMLGSGGRVSHRA